MIPAGFRRPLMALAGGALVLAIVQRFAASPRAAAMARDLAASTGFPVATTTDIGGPWGSLLLGGAAAWTIWVCLQTRSFLLQLALLAAALGLCLTGSWLAGMGGGGFPTVPVMLALFLAFILGQFAAGFSGGPRTMALRSLLENAVSPARLQAILAAPIPPAQSDKDCLVTVIECPADDTTFLETLRDGLQSGGAWTRRQGDGRLLVVHGLWEESPEAPAAWRALALAAESLAGRPDGWKLATLAGPLTRLIEWDPAPALFLRGTAPGVAASWLDQDQSPADGLPVWLAHPDGHPDHLGWDPISPSVPTRLRPVAESPAGAKLSGPNPK